MLAPHLQTALQKQGTYVCKTSFQSTCLQGVFPEHASEGVLQGVFPEHVSARCLSRTRVCKMSFQSTCQQGVFPENKASVQRTTPGSSLRAYGQRVPAVYSTLCHMTQLIIHPGQQRCDSSGLRATVEHEITTVCRLQSPYMVTPDAREYKLQAKLQCTACAACWTTSKMNTKF